MLASFASDVVEGASWQLTRYVIVSGIGRKENFNEVVARPER